MNISRICSLHPRSRRHSVVDVLHCIHNTPHGDLLTWLVHNISAASLDGNHNASRAPCVIAIAVNSCADRKPRWICKWLVATWSRLLRPYDLPGVLIECANLKGSSCQGLPTCEERPGTCVNSAQCNHIKKASTNTMIEIHTYSQKTLYIIMKYNTHTYIYKYNHSSAVESWVMSKIN